MGGDGVGMMRVAVVGFVAVSLTVSLTVVAVLTVGMATVVATMIDVVVAIASIVDAVFETFILEHGK